MTTRERNLAMILLVVLVVLGIGIVANATVLQPLTSVNGEIDKADLQLDQRRKEIKAETDRITRIEKLNPRLAQWQKLSLPEGDPRAEAYKAHLGKLSRDYQRYLNKALVESGFTVRSMKVGPDFDSRTAPMVDKKPIGQILTSHIEGEATLESVVKLFEELYRAPVLHQIKTFSIASVKTSTNLAVKLTLEAILVNGAEHINKRDGDIFAKFTNKGKDKEPVVLAREKGRYRDMATRNNIFTPAREEKTQGPDDRDMAADISSDLVYVHLTMIYWSDFHGGCWVARIDNKGNKGDAALLIDAPLPKQSPYQKVKKEIEEKKRQGLMAKRPRRGDNEKQEEDKNLLEEPVQKWVLRDHFKQPLFDLQVVRIEGLKRVIFQVDGKFFAIHPNETLFSAMRKENEDGDLVDNELDKEELKKLGLLGDTTEVLKKVKLTEVSMNKDRDNSFEGKFINPSNKDEKKALATSPTPEQFASNERPQFWTIKDNLGTEVIKLTVLRVDKDRLFFEVDKKCYAIKPGSTLHEAMAKPLSESEIKELKLKE